MEEMRERADGEEEKANCSEGVRKLMKERKGNEERELGERGGDMVWV